MDINKRYDETNYEYIKRIVYGKLVDKTIDLDYELLSESLFGEGNCYNSSEVRKRMYGMKRIFELIDNEKVNSITDEDILSDLEVKKIELQKEKYKIQTLRLDLNRIIRESSRTELLMEEFILALKECEQLPFPEFKELHNQSVNKQYILSFADSHFGKEFESITNEYDLNIVYDRFNKLLNEIIEIVEECNINKLKILALGDLVEGMCLRISQLSSLKVGITKQTIQFMRFLVSWLNKVSEIVEIEYYSTPYSNHGQIRPFGSKANEFVSEDVEQIIFAYVYDMLEKNPRIRVVECENKHLIFNIFDYNIIATHGHDIKNPEDFIKDTSDKYKIFFDYAFFAHKHNSATKTVGEGQTNNCEIINIPSIMGCDEYADDLLVGSKAGATLIEFTEKQGKRKTYDIILN